MRLPFLPDVQEGFGSLFKPTRHIRFGSFPVGTKREASGKGASA